ncbi:hypothetical protein [Vibrio palustris]|uniref:DNA polymerase III subunit beta n=1 Tax=Vibrio palustris TaxID=1918946 RepID=A0A1R4AZR5_9VIBR|nr:hypothetical protein [Vibrio palustris]SJL82154.1 hypothetical protein VPAL9027_00064 [Vibrio palustris]
MKRLIAIALAVALSACSFSPQVDWKQGSLAELAKIDIQLKSNLWTDQMPTMSKDTKTKNLNGTLTLETSGGLPADLTVKQIVFKQGDATWNIDGETVELRTQSENVWEAVFESGIKLNLDQPVSVALALDDDGQEVWLVEHNVGIDKVY